MRTYDCMQVAAWCRLSICLLASHPLPNLHAASAISLHILVVLQEELLLPKLHATFLVASMPYGHG